MSAVLKFQTDLFVLECASCSMTFAFPQDFEQRRRADKATFYCPAGHSNVYGGESDKARADRLARELIAQREATRRESERVDQRDRSLRAARGNATKLRKRIANGVCPCCKRTFAELGRHMKTKHPDYAKQDIG